MCILSLRLGFALHLDDEALAFLGGDGDILHVRSSLWWLDGCGVFTMPQRTAACSIILCIYLVGQLVCLLPFLQNNPVSPANRPPGTSSRPSQSMPS